MKTIQEAREEQLAKIQEIIDDNLVPLLKDHLDMVNTPNSEKEADFITRAYVSKLEKAGYPKWPLEAVDIKIHIEGADVSATVRQANLKEITCS